MSDLRRSADEFSEKMSAALHAPADYTPPSRRVMWALGGLGVMFAGLISVTAVVSAPTPEAAPVVSCLRC